MSEMKLAKVFIPIYRADGRRAIIGLSALRLLTEAGRIAKLIQRKRDKAITRAYMYAEPNEIAPMSHRTATVVQVLPATYTHRSSLAKGL